MIFENNKKASLILADGTVFEGRSFGAEGRVIGEIVFTTAMTGYQETLTDPSYCGQIVTQTFPLIGNYGVNSIDPESNGSVVSGYIVREHCEDPSNFRCEGDLDSYLKKYNIIGIYDIDTRHLTKIIRESGVMNGAKTEKLKYGHRGGNQPVKDIALDRTFITSQNHGYAVVSDSVPAEAGEVSHVNGNDGTCEGVRYHNAPAFTVQFHPEACGGPKDTAYLFDEFIDLMEGKKSCR